MSDFDSLVRGSIIMSFSPSGELKRYIVTEPNVRGVHPGKEAISADPEVGHRVAELTATNELSFAGEHLTPRDIDELEGFGYTFTYWPGAVFQIPEGT